MTPISLLRDHRFFILILIVEAVLVAYVTSPWTTADTVDYLRLAGDLRRGHYGPPDVLRPPGYPVALAALFGLGAPIVVAIQLGLAIIAILLGDQLCDRHPIYRAIALIYPFSLLYSSSLGTEAWAMLGVTSAGFLLCQGHSRVRYYALLAGLALGLASLFRSDCLPLIPLAVLVVLLWWKRPVDGLALVAAAALPLAPYAIWNAENFGKPIPAAVASSVGCSLYFSTWQPLLTNDDIDTIFQRAPDAAVEKSGILREFASINRSLGAEPMTVPFNPSQYETNAQQIAVTKLTLQLAMARIRASPEVYATHLAENVWRLWNTGRYPGPRLVSVVVKGLSAAVFFLGVFGAYLAIRWRTRLLPAAMLLLGVWAIHIPLHTEARYTASARVLLVVLAASGAARSLRRLRRPGRSDDVALFAA